MKYELDVLAALAQLHNPTTRDIVAKTGISERKVQTVLNTLQSELKVHIRKEKVGRNIRYIILDWGVFESGSILQVILEQRLSKSDSAPSLFLGSRYESASTQLKSDFYESVKMQNFIESSRLEGVSVPKGANTSIEKDCRLRNKESLIQKYTKQKATSKSS